MTCDNHCSSWTNLIFALIFRKSYICSILILPLLRPEIPVPIPLRPLYPGFNLLTAEEGSPAGLVVGDTVEVKSAADEFNLRVAGNHPPEFIDVNPILLRADGAV